MPATEPKRSDGQITRRKIGMHERLGERANHVAVIPMVQRQVRASEEGPFSPLLA